MSYNIVTIYNTKLHNDCNFKTNYKIMYNSYNTDILNQLLMLHYLCHLVLCYMLIMFMSYFLSKCHFIIKLNNFLYIEKIK
jgi:hypothetical protein